MGEEVILQIIRSFAKEKLHKMTDLTFSEDYKVFLENIKTAIRTAQVRAALAANETLIRLYWDIGKNIVAKQEALGWGAAVVEQLAIDLKREFSDASGYSRTNVFYFRQFYLFYRDANEKVQQLVGQIPWGHNILIFSKIKDLKAAEFYLLSTIENGWSRNILDLQIDTQLHERQGKAITNFEWTLPKPQSGLAIDPPLGVSEYVLTHILPDNLKNILPTTEQLERELDEQFDLETNIEK